MSELIFQAQPMTMVLLARCHCASWEPQQFFPARFSRGEIDMPPNYTTFWQDVEPSSMLPGFVLDFRYVAPLRNYSASKAKFKLFTPVHKLGWDGATCVNHIHTKATGNSRSGIPENSRESRTPKFPAGIPGNFWNSGGNYGEFREFCLFSNFYSLLWHFSV